MQRKRKKLLCMTAAAVFALSGLSGCHGKGQDTEGGPVVLEDASGEDGKEAKDGGVRDAGEDEQKESPKEAADSIVVYVCGKVRKEGVVTLPAGSRIYQAIEMAGGMADDAAASYLNLAEVLTDGARVYVPGTDDAEVGNSSIPQGNTAGGFSGETDGKVNINQASKEELMTLPGIGEVKADAIIQYRTEQGKFASIEEIKNISGIKDGVFEKMKDKYPVIGDVRGLGAMIGVEFVKDRKSKEPAPAFVNRLVQSALQKGLLLENAGSAGNVVRFLAPLCMTDEQMEAGLGIFEDSIKENL